MLENLAMGVESYLTGNNRLFTHANCKPASSLFFVVRPGIAVLEQCLSSPVKIYRARFGFYGVAALVGILFQDRNGCFLARNVLFRQCANQNIVSLLVLIFHELQAPLSV